MEKKEPIEFALKSLDNFTIARHNEYHYISSNFASIALREWKQRLFHSINRIVLKKGVLHSSNKVLPGFSLI